MPSPVAHTFAAYVTFISLQPELASDRRRNSLVLGAAFVLGSLADADFVVAHFTTQPYLRHHYFSHSIPFALAFTLLCWIVLKLLRQPFPGKWSGLCGAAYSSHLLLDYLTEDGSFPYGIPLFWPFTDLHFVSPFHVFYSIHRGTWQAIFSPENLHALVVEVAVMAPVTLLVVLLVRRNHKQSKTGINQAQ